MQRLQHELTEGWKGEYEQHRGITQCSLKHLKFDQVGNPHVVYKNHSIIKLVSVKTLCEMPILASESVPHNLNWPFSKL